MRTTVYLTRHGLSEHNLVPHVYMGRAPASRLVEQGREQARRLGARLAAGAAVHRIVCSSLPRTRETADIVAEALGGVPVESDEAFQELSKGAWEGVMPKANLPPDIVRALADDPFGYRYPQGESYRDVAARTGPAFDRCVAAHAGDSLLFMLHGDVVRALLYHLLCFPPARIADFVLDPCSLTEFHLEGGRHVLVRCNDYSHLDGTGSPVGEHVP